MLRNNIASAHITKDEIKYNTTINNLDECYYKQIENVIINSLNENKYVYIK